MRKVRHFLRHNSLSIVAKLASPSTGPVLRCLYAHFVYDDQIRRFDRIIQTLMGQGTFVDAETVLGMANAEIPIDDTYFHLSFDDGFRNIARNALPVLMHHRLPATFFVATSMIGADWDLARDYSMNITNNAGAIELCTWSDLREAQRYGMEIGSHTRTHACLSAIASEDELRNEVHDSKQAIEDQLQAECRFLSWPYGTPADINDAALAAIKDAGYQACFSAVRGTVVPGLTDPFNIPRHQVEFNWPTSHILYFAEGNRD